MTAKLRPQVIRVRYDSGIVSVDGHPLKGSLEDHLGIGYDFIPRSPIEANYDEGVPEKVRQRFDYEVTKLNIKLDDSRMQLATMA